MPGPPLDTKSANFQPIVIFLQGNGGDGKSTAGNAIINSNTKFIQLDAWCYECLNPSIDPKFSLSETISKNDKDTIIKLKSYFESKMNDIDRSSKIYIFEGYVLKIDELKKVIKHSIRTNYFWNMNRDKSWK